MAIEFVGVKKRWRRRTLTRNRRPAKYKGQKGWNWFEAILSNEFTNIDNVVANFIVFAEGDSFNSTDDQNVIGNAKEMTVVFRTIRMQLQVSVIHPDPSGYPLIAYDIGLVKFITGVNVGQQPLALDLQGLLLTTGNRVIWHRRIWAAVQGAVVGEAEDPYGVNPQSSFIDMQIRPNVPLAPQERLALVISQVDSELYTDTMGALATGYIKSWVQTK